ncbi:MAG: bile acid:sodium symporter family protein [Muribaculaceae bacterium]|nr:bile acid:sodium symporter family protein [Muribaculaceae bacterium]
MNPILLVIPILSVLMFDLGLSLNLADFKRIFKQPKAATIGLLGQIVVLPLIAFALALILDLQPLFFVGFILIACCPGGSSSNIFSKLAKGDVALSVTLTAFSSIITLFTLPLIMSWAVTYANGGVSTAINLPVGNLLIQNIILMLVPIILGVLMKMRWEKAAQATDKLLSKIAFPALMLLAGIFFVQHYDTIAAYIGSLCICLTLLIIVAAGMAALISRVARLTQQERRTIVIEVGMQNAAQAIAVASSPFIFNKPEIAFPAIIYALMMNVVLLTYVGFIKYRHK